MRSLAAALLLIVTHGCSSPAPLAEVTVDATATGVIIPKDFLGLSLEYDLVLPFLGGDAAPNLVYRQLLRNLGPGVLRVGGDSEDDACWNPSGAPQPPSCHLPLTAEMARSIFATAVDTDWRVILGVNLALDDPAAAASYVKEAVLPAPGVDHLLAVEIGNEPDNYSHRISYTTDGGAPVTIRPAAYSEANHRAEFTAYANAIGAVASLPLSGPADCCSWLGDLGAFPAGVDPALGGHLALLTVHEYPTSVCGGGPSDPWYGTIANLLAPTTSATFRDQIKGYTSAAAQSGHPLRIDEANSVACGGGGRPGVSDAFAAALWALDFLFTSAEAGTAGVNLHTYKNGAYSPILVHSTGSGAQTIYTHEIRPLYYALWVFAREAEGRQLATATVTNSSAHIAAFAVDEGNGAKVFLLNEDLSLGGEVVVHPTARMASATLLLLAAPALDDTTATRVGGGAFDATTGNAPESMRTALAPDDQGAFHIQLPVAAAAVLTMTP